MAFDPDKFAEEAGVPSNLNPTQEPSQEKKEVQNDQTLLHKYHIPGITPAADFIAKFITGKSQEEVEKPYTMDLKGAKEVGSDLASVAAFLINPEGGIVKQMIVNAATNAGSRGVKGLLNNEDPIQNLMNSLKEGGIAGAASGALPILGKGIAKVLPQFGKLAKIEKPVYEKALQGELSGNSYFGDYLKKSGEKLGQVKSFLKSQGGGPPINSPQTAKDIEDIISKYTTNSGEHALEKSDVKQVETILDKIKGGSRPPVEDANIFKNQIQNQINYSGKPRITQSDNFMNEVARRLDQDVESLSPELFNANKDYSSALDINNQFSGWKPKITPYHGSALGLGMYAGHSIPGVVPLGMAAVVGAIPEVQKGIIKTAGSVARGYNHIPSQILPTLVAKSNETKPVDQNGSTNPDWLEIQRLIRGGK